jgi:flagellar motor switch protein FliM
MLALGWLNQGQAAMTAAVTDVIRRKIDRARPAMAEGAPGADRGWRLALARATRDAMGLDLDFRRLTITRASLAEILETVPDRALLALLDGPAGGLGVIMLSSSVTATMIEMQTLGRLTAQSPVPRKPSRIDAAMVAGVIDRALAGLDETLAEEADLVWAGGFRYASYLEDARPLGLMLEDEGYRVLSADVSLGLTARDGQVILVLPADGRGEHPVLPSADGEGAVPNFSTALQAQVMQADCRLDAVVGRLTLPLRQIMTLAVGDTLQLPLAALDAVSIETVDGCRVAGARLGQHRGMRALKLTEAVAAQAAPQPVHRPAAVAPLDEPGGPELRATG